MQKLINTKNKKGFTLIEMLIVILIIVVLIAIAVPFVTAYRKNAERTADLGAAKTVYSALEAQLAIHGELSLPVTGMSQSGDIIYSHQVWGPAASFPGNGFGNTVNGNLGPDFDGIYKFGYDTTTNSVVWVSYHDNKHSGVSHRASNPFHVMIYDVENGVEGYAKELGAPYTEAMYNHAY